MEEIRSEDAAEEEGKGKKGNRVRVGSVRGLEEWLERKWISEEDVEDYEIESRTQKIKKEKEAGRVGRGEERRTEIGWEEVKEEWMEEIGVMMKKILKEVMEEVVKKEHEVRIEIWKIKRKREQEMVEWRKAREKLTKRIEELETRESKREEEGSGKEGSTKIEFRMKELKWGRK